MEAYSGREGLSSLRLSGLDEQPVTEEPRHKKHGREKTTCPNARRRENSIPQGTYSESTGPRSARRPVAVAPEPLTSPPATRQSRENPAITTPEELAAGCLTQEEGNLWV
jgi:hypothetical protein